MMFQTRVRVKYDKTRDIEILVGLPTEGHAYGYLRSKEEYEQFIADLKVAADQIWETPDAADAR